MRESAARFIAVASIALAATTQTACAQLPPIGKGDTAARVGSGANAASAKPESASQEPFWYDGDRKRVLQVDPEWVADFRGPKPNLERAPEQPATAAAGKSSPALSAGQSQVLRDETGAPRALPGGIIVRLRDADVPDASRLFAELGLTPVRAIDPEERTWLVESPAGLESLALANRLHETGRFESATPNWWRPRALK